MSSFLTLGVVAHVDAGKTTLTERLLFEAGAIDALGSVDAGTTRTDSLALELPDGVTVVRQARGRADVIVSFHTERATFERRLPELRACMEPAAGLWIAWPKRASKVPTDLDENVVRDTGLANALVDNKVAAIDEVWSGLRLVIRLKDRR